MEENKEAEPKAPETNETNGHEQKPIQLVITMMPSGEVSVNGPIVNKVLCYGLLKCAEEAIFLFNINAQSKLIKPQANFLDFLRRQNKR